MKNKRRIRLIPYKAGSKSATALAKAVRGKCLKVDGTSRFRNTPNDFLINWGRTERLPNIDYHYVLNHPEAVAQVSNKLTFFEGVKADGYEHLLPQFWTNKDDIPDDAFPIVCRTLLNSHSGRGIVLASNRGELVDAPLYTQYVKKQDEYRIHFAWPLKAPDWDKSIILAVQQKKRRLDVDEPNWQIRNHDNGFVYAREGVNAPDCVVTAAKEIFERCTELDFGAVDVVYNAKQDRAYVLEVNSAPGLEGKTLEDYANHYGNI
jgi:hypothetical protein